MMIHDFLWQRGRWQLFHDWMSTSGGMYSTHDSYLSLDFQVFHCDGISVCVSVLAPVIGDVDVQVQNKRSAERHKRSPYFRNTPFMTKRVSLRRRSYAEVVQRDLEIREMNERRAKKL